MTGRPTDLINYILGAHWEREFSPKLPPSILNRKQKSRQMDRWTNVSNYRVDY